MESEGPLDCIECWRVYDLYKEHLPDSTEPDYLRIRAEGAHALVQQALGLTQGHLRDHLTPGIDLRGLSSLVNGEECQGREQPRGRAAESVGYRGRRPGSKSWRYC